MTGVFCFFFDVSLRGGDHGASANGLLRLLSRWIWVERDRDVLKRRWNGIDEGNLGETPG